MRPTLLLAIIGCLMLLTSCRKDFEFEPSKGDLGFSKDTVYLDTVFTNIGSSTYTLKVYNNTRSDINIPVIQLGKGLSSKYRITVDGMQGDQNRVFNNVELLAKDSLYIFIETTANIADANASDFLYTDQILFDIGAKQQKVELVTLIQDAVFLYPQRFEDGSTETLQLGEDEIYGFVLDENDPIHGNEYEFTNEKPYVIYGYAAVGNNKTLHIAAGARVHFHQDSGLIVATGGSIQALGGYASDPIGNQEIVFEGDRLEPGFSDVPGQWSTIWLTSGAAASTFRNVTIKNSVIGLYVQNNSGNLSLENVQIYNSSNFGILAQNGTITGQNLAISSAGEANLACTYGGNYNFTHCTFNNNWPSSKQVAVLISNYINGAEPEAMPLQQAQFNNCIIYGSNQVEMFLDKKPAADFNYKFNHCLIRFNNINNQFTNHPLYQFTTDQEHYTSCYIATSSLVYKPSFWNINKNNLRIDLNSAAIEKADLNYFIPLDLIGQPRITNDLGAYQSIPIPD